MKMRAVHPVVFEPGTVDLCAVCDGPGADGECSLRPLNGRVGCAGKAVVVPGDMVGHSFHGSVSRVRLMVYPDATTCPLTKAQRTRWQRLPEMAEGCFIADC